ncbi:hypothetical protein ACOMHN_065754 [Nucella lapillus]
MGEQNKELQKQQENQKRLCDGHVDIPADLYAKRPRYETSGDETDRQCERRQKNKEAAEKSRRKKKEEFAKMQTENDQLQQDKCQLVAEIEKLKDVLTKASKENGTLHSNIDHLKRWIGKHAKDLGLGRHVQKKQAEEMGLLKPMKVQTERVLRADPSLHSAGLPTAADSELVQSRSASTSPPLSSASMWSSAAAPGAVSPSSKFQASSLAPLYPQVASSPPLLSSQGSQDCFQPVGIRTMLTLPQLPLTVPQFVAQPPEAHLYGSITTGQQEEVNYSAGHPFIYFSNNAFYMVPGDDDRQVLMVAPKVQPDTGMDVSEVQQITMEAQSVQQISEEAPGSRQASVEKASEVQMGGEEGQEMQVPKDEATESQGWYVGTPEVQEHTGDSSQVPQSTEKGPEMQVASDESSDRKGAPQGDMAENQAAATEGSTETTIKNIESGVPDTKIAIPSFLAGSIELLLKLGYKIQVPDDILKSRSEVAAPSVDR